MSVRSQASQRSETRGSGRYGRRCRYEPTWVFGLILLSGATGYGLPRVAVADGPDAKPSSEYWRLLTIRPRKLVSGSRILVMTDGRLLACGQVNDHGRGLTERRLGCAVFDGRGDGVTPGRSDGPHHNPQEVPQGDTEPGWHSIAGPAGGHGTLRSLQIDQEGYPWALVDAMPREPEVPTHWRLWQSPGGVDAWAQIERPEPAGRFVGLLDRPSGDRGWQSSTLFGEVALLGEAVLVRERAPDPQAACQAIISFFEAVTSTRLGFGAYEWRLVTEHLPRKTCWGDRGAIKVLEQTVRGPEGEGALPQTPVVVTPLARLVANVLACDLGATWAPGAIYASLTSQPAPGASIDIGPCLVALVEAEAWSDIDQLVGPGGPRAGLLAAKRLIVDRVAANNSGPALAKHVAQGKAVPGCRTSGNRQAYVKVFAQACRVFGATPGCHQQAKINKNCAVRAAEEARQAQKEGREQQRRGGIFLAICLVILAGPFWLGTGLVWTRPSLRVARGGVTICGAGSGGYLAAVVTGFVYLTWFHTMGTDRFGLGAVFFGAIAFLPGALSGGAVAYLVARRRENRLLMPAFLFGLPGIALLTFLGRGLLKAW